MRMDNIQTHAHTHTHGQIDLFTFFSNYSHEVPFKRLFAPTYWSPMSRLFRFLEFFGKSNGKKWSQIWKLLLLKGVKSPHNKKKIMGEFCLTKQDFWYWCFFSHRSRDSWSPVCRIFFNHFIEWECGKSED